jgi:uncharacterized protein YecE (DUF72 family)
MCRPFFLFLCGMAKGKIYIGTSGWSYKDWKGAYYPEQLKSEEWLAYHAKNFNTTEINTSFYHLPKPETVQHWAEQTPKKFKFCPKISRYITHIKRLAQPEETLPRFFEVFDLIKDRLGPVLIQLHPNLKFDKERAEHFFKVLRKKYPDYSFAFELRHDSWLCTDCYKLLRKYEIAFVISQSGEGFPYAEEVTAKDIYVRFHGPEQLYASEYSKEMLQDYAKKFKKWQKEGHDIWAFFNNDWYAYAVKNARELMELV